MKKLDKHKRCIGSASYRHVTKEELCKMIMEEFANDEAHIAVITTTSYGDYDDPIVNQSVTFGKIFETCM